MPGGIKRNLEGNASRRFKGLRIGPDLAQSLRFLFKIVHNVVSSGVILITGEKRMKGKAVGTQYTYGSLLMVTLIVVLSAMPAWAQNKVPTLRGPAAGAAGQSAAKISPQQAGTLTCNLWNQPQGSVNPNPYANQDFAAPDDSLDIFLADDFSTSRRPWRIDTIFVPGALWNAVGPSLANAAALHFEIYRDSGGKPDGDPRGGGKPPVWSLAVPPTDSQIVIETMAIDPLINQGNVILTLESPIRLKGGTYWFVFYPELDFATSGQYGRFTADTTNLLPAKVVNPDQGWRQDPADPDSPLLPASWANASSFLPVFSQHDLAFCLQGRVDFYWPMFVPATTGAGTR